ncbi:MAG: hypothetical protein F6K19_17835 [Cyanothece sp. SIO1E1]|nr:hypothetical protein [Cyanothece sp. SIO1E1]
MKRPSTITAALVTAFCLESSPISLPATAQPRISYCQLGEIRPSVPTEIDLKSIYVSEAGSLLEVCIDINNARLAVSATGDLTLLQRESSVRLAYYNSGIRAGQLQRIGTVTLDYHRRGLRAGKLKRIGNVDFDYHLSSTLSIKLRSKVSQTMC